MNRTVKTMIYCALFAALTAVCSQLAIPIQPVPINLALLSVYIAGGLLGGGSLLGFGFGLGGFLLLSFFSLDFLLFRLGAGLDRIGLR